MDSEQARAALHAVRDDPNAAPTERELFYRALATCRDLIRWSSRADSQRSLSARSPMEGANG